MYSDTLWDIIYRPLSHIKNSQIHRSAQQQFHSQCFFTVCDETSMMQLRETDRWKMLVKTEWWFSTCVKAVQTVTILNTCISPVPLPLGVTHTSLIRHHHHVIILKSNALICWNMHVCCFSPGERNALSYTNLLWLTPAYIPRWQNECCHGNLLPGNPNSLATSQTVAMAQLSIDVCWDWWVSGLFRAPPFQSFQSNTWGKNLSDRSKVVEVCVLVCVIASSKIPSFYFLFQYKLQF